VYNRICSSGHTRSILNSPPLGYIPIFLIFRKEKQIGLRSEHSKVLSYVSVEGGIHGKIAQHTVTGTTAERRYH
jgi:hypothetical protein